MTQIEPRCPGHPPGAQAPGRSSWSGAESGATAEALAFRCPLGQAIRTNAYLRPARPIKLPEAVKKKFLPDSDYARAASVDWGQMENVQKGFVDRYLAEVR